MEESSTRTEEMENVFNLNNKTPGDEGDDEDLSDSEDSVFSGLEDSGSDSEDEEEGEEEGSHEEEDLKDDQILQPEKKKGGLTAEEEKKEDEYRQDSSDEEKIFKPIRNKDELDEFLDKMDNPDYWRTIHDKQTGSDIILSDDQVALVNRLQRGQFGDLHFNEYQLRRDAAPVTNRPADKRSFIPSLVEKEKVSKLVHAIKMGWIKPKRHEEAGGRFYDLWANEDCTTSLARLKMHLPAPRAPLPGHMESYNPPPEYLFTEEEKALWEQQDVSDRKCPFVPRRFSSLLQVPAFPRFLHERFERCLDLYLCPRQRKLRSVAWNPNASLSLLAVALDSMVLVLSPSLADKQIVSASERLLAGPQGAEPAEEAGPVTWTDTEGEELNQGIRLKIQHPKPVQQVAWHAKGDYLASVMPDHSSHLQVFIHQVSRRRSQNPFRKNKGLVQCVSFHPVRPYFFVATQRSVRIYNLVKQEMTKKLQANSKWISSMAVHPGGDHVICGSYDCRLSWFDLDLSTKPYKMLRHHKKAVRGVAYHRLYPLFASASDDGSVIVCHGTVYNDLLQNPLLVPVKVLRGHVITHDLGVLDVTFHPSQPWVFSSGADATIRLSPRAVMEESSTRTEEMENICRTVRTACSQDWRILGVTARMKRRERRRDHMKKKI
ncbi:hypothetical protein F7725_024613 [Dissostichus mawsoni]|uniref:BOP1 N-terminal domain-containing protein n=1 Tax=Dissostichus mawsoni TaxID=36200 RepID=A0A7J5X9S6_DISMA|nr:hypothetical protein F7725_024613 [Dissostichus mawsoni]